MNPKQFQAIFPLKLSLLLNKFPLLLLTQHPTILCENLIVLPHRLGRNTLINELLHFLVDKERVGGLLFLTRFHGGLNLVDQTLKFDGAVVLDVSGVLVHDEDLAQTLAAVGQVLELLLQFGNLGLFAVIVTGLEEGLVPAEFSSEVL